MEKQPILLIGDNLKNIRDILDNMEIDFIEYSGNKITLLENTLRGKRIEPEIAFIHLSNDDQRIGVCRNPFTKPLVNLLPETTRRIIVCNGLCYPEQAKNAAIEIHGDMLVDGNRICHDFYDDYIEKGSADLIKIIGKSYVSQDEINERGKTIEYINEIRDEISTPPERDRGFEPHEYSDDYFRRR